MLLWPATMMMPSLNSGQSPMISGSFGASPVAIGIVGEAGGMLAAGMPAVGAGGGGMVGRAMPAAPVIAGGGEPPPLRPPSAGVIGGNIPVPAAPPPGPG